MLQDRAGGLTSHGCKRPWPQEETDCSSGPGPWAPVHAAYRACEPRAPPAPAEAAGPVGTGGPGISEAWWEVALAIKGKSVLPDE